MNFEQIDIHLDVIRSDLGAIIKAIDEGNDRASQEPLRELSDLLVSILSRVHQIPPLSSLDRTFSEMREFSGEDNYAECQRLMSNPSQCAASYYAKQRAKNWLARVNSVITPKTG